MSTATWCLPTRSSPRTRRGTGAPTLYQEGVVQPSFDKQFVRNWLTSPESGWDRGGDKPPPPLPPDIVDATRERYIDAYGASRAIAVRRLDRLSRDEASYRPVQNGSSTVVSTTATSSSTRTSGCATKSIPRSSNYLGSGERVAPNRSTARIWRRWRQKIFDEIKARTGETDLSVPTRRGGWWHYSRSFRGQAVQRALPLVRSPIGDDWTPTARSMSTREVPGRA